MRTLAASVLFFEAVLMVLVVPVVIALTDVGPATAVASGLVFAVLCLVTAGLLRHAWAYGVGWGLQVLLVASGFVVPAMFLLGGIFAVLWGVGLHVGRKGEQVRAARLAAAGGPVDVTGKPSG
jgi:hypothetical protein